MSLDKLLDTGIEAIDEEAVDECRAVDGTIRGASKILGIPSVGAEKGSLDIMEGQLGGEPQAARSNPTAATAMPARRAGRPTRDGRVWTVVDMAGPSGWVTSRPRR